MPRAAVLMLAGAALLAPAAASADGPTWAVSDVTTEERPNGDVAVAVSRDPGAGALVLWRQAGDPEGAADSVRSSVRPAAGAWQPAQDVVPPGEAVSTIDVVLGPDGVATAVWDRIEDGEPATVRTASRSPGGTWSAPTTLGPGRGPRLAADGFGDLTALWLVPGEPDGTYVIATRRSGQLAFTPPVAVTEPDESTGPADLAVGTYDDAVVTWVTGEARPRVRAVVRHQQAWGPAVTLSGAASGPPPDLRPRDPRAAVDDAGRITVLWTETDEESCGRDCRVGTAYALQGATRMPAGDWSAATPVAGGARFVSGTRLTAAPDGRLTALWLQQAADGDDTVLGASAAPGGAWGPPTPLHTETGQPVSPALGLAAAGDGTVTATWSTLTDAPLGTLRTATRTGSAWHPSGVLSWRAGDAAVAAGASGALAAWPESSTATRSTIRAADAMLPRPAVAAPPPPAAAPPAVPGVPVPALTALSVTRSAIRPARTGGAVRSAPPTRFGTRVLLRLDRPGSVRFTVRRRLRSGRTVALPGGFTRTPAPSGADAFTFSGRVGGRTLRPGRYVLQATPAAGGRTGTPRRVSFRVAASRR